MRLLSTSALLLTALSAASFATEVTSVTAGPASFASNFQIYKAETLAEMATIPSFTMGAPAGFVPGWGTMFMGATGMSNSDTTDAAFAIGMGLGDPIEGLGGAATLALGSVDPRDGGAGNRGTLQLTAGKSIEKYDLGLAMGLSDIDLWHDSDMNEYKPSFYMAGTKLFPNFFLPAIVTAGFGNNTYSKTAAKEESNLNRWGVFGSAAVYIIPQISLILDYTSGMTSAGVGIVPFPKLPVSFVVGAADLFKQAADEKVTFTAGISAAYSF